MARRQLLATFALGIFLLVAVAYGYAYATSGREPPLWLMVVAGNAGSALITIATRDGAGNGGNGHA